MKIFFRRIHLYLALAAGLVITCSCLTGAILVFEDEWLHTINHKNYYVQPDAERLPLQEMVKKIKDKIPDAVIGSVKVYSDPARSVEINYKLKGTKKPKNGPEYNWKVFANPYTGEIIEEYNVRKTFFFKVLSIHRWLMADDTGKLITGTSTLFFFFIIITGIILWWPANKNILKQRLKIKRGASWKRTNMDWHMVMGFYASILLFITVFTGLSISFKWFSNSMMYVTGSPLENPKPPKSGKHDKDAKKAGFDVVYEAVASHTKHVVFYNVNAPKKEGEVYNVAVLPKDASHESAIDNYYVDAYTGKEVGRLLYAGKSTGARLKAIFKPIHTGGIWGLPSKVISFIVVLIGASLPVTGYIIWLNRAFKKRKKAFV
jgi:uncharacterized iron-regulated membrane protein